MHALIDRGEAWFSRVFYSCCEHTRLDIRQIMRSLAGEIEVGLENGRDVRVGV
jgi:hypothetical protein